MRRFALTIIFASMLLLGGSYASAFLPGGPPAFVPWVFATATASAMIAVLMLGVARKGIRLGILGWVFGFCFLCVAGGFGMALAAEPVAAGARLWLGLPGGAATILFVVAFPPMLVLPLAYALTFDTVTLSDAELDVLRARLEAMREEPRT